MDFRNFFEIFGALKASENELKNLGVCQSEALEKIATAKVRLLKQFSRFCPGCAVDAKKLPNFDCELFWSLFRFYPQVLDGNEGKVFDFMVSVSRYERRHQGKRVFLNDDAVSVLTDARMQKYLFCHRPAELKAFLPKLQKHYSRLTSTSALKPLWDFADIK